MSNVFPSSASIASTEWTFDSESCDSNFELKVSVIPPEDSRSNKTNRNNEKERNKNSLMAKIWKKARIGLHRHNKENNPATSGPDNLETSEVNTERSNNGQTPTHPANIICINSEVDADEMPTEITLPDDKSIVSKNLHQERKKDDTRRKSEKKRLETEHADVTLMSADGGSVPAVRAKLVARSSKFSSLLRSREEGDLPSKLSLKYDTLTICAIVKFCYSGSIDMSLYSSKECAARSLVWLVAASHWCKIHDLEKKARNQIHEVLSKWRPIACAVLDAAIATEDRTTRDLASIAMLVIRANPRAVLLGPSDLHMNLGGGGVRCIGMTTLYTILNDKTISNEAIVMFRCLRLWAESDVNSVVGKGSKQREKINRVAAAKKMTQLIQLSKISPTELEKEVMESGLVTADQANDACKEWARAVLSNEHKWEPSSSLGSTHRRSKRGGIVIVRDAGIDEVNGAYIASPNKSLKLYSKAGNWEGKRVKFHLYRSKQHWHLGLPNHDPSVEFYSAPLCSDNEHIPPNNNWCVHNSEKIRCEEVEFPPSCVWISESSNLYL